MGKVIVGRVIVGRVIVGRVNGNRIKYVRYVSFNYGICDCGEGEWIPIN